MILEKPRYVTKQAAQIMVQEGKLDLLLKTLEENERKRAEAEESSSGSARSQGYGGGVASPSGEMSPGSEYNAGESECEGGSAGEQHIMSGEDGEHGGGDQGGTVYRASPSQTPFANPWYAKSFAQFFSALWIGFCFGSGRDWGGNGVVAGSVPPMTCP